MTTENRPTSEENAFGALYEQENLPVAGHGAGETPTAGAPGGHGERGAADVSNAKDNKESG